MQRIVTMVLTRAFVRASARLHTCGQSLPVLVAALLRPQRARVHEVCRVLIRPEEEHLSVQHIRSAVCAQSKASAHTARRWALVRVRVRVCVLIRACVCFERRPHRPPHSAGATRCRSRAACNRAARRCTCAGTALAQSRRRMWAQSRRRMWV